MKDKFPSWRPSILNFHSNETPNGWMKKGEKIAKRNSSVIYSFIHLIVLHVVQVLSTFTIHAWNQLHSSTFHGITCQQCELFAVQDHFRSILGIICSLRITCTGDHLWYCTNLISLMTSSLVTIETTLFNVCRNVYSRLLAVRLFS